MRVFEHLGETWQALPTGTGTSAGFVGPGGALPAIDRWGVIFRSKTKPQRGEYRASISQQDPNRVDDADLKRALEEQLVLASINRSRYIWRPAEAISDEIGLPIDRVLHILENTTAADVISGTTNGKGQQLYTTRDHLSKASGDFMKQYYSTEESS